MEKSKTCCSVVTYNEDKSCLRRAVVLIHGLAYCSKHLALLTKAEIMAAVTPKVTR